MKVRATTSLINQTAYKGVYFVGMDINEVMAKLTGYANAVLRRLDGSPPTRSVSWKAKRFKAGLEVYERDVMKWLFCF
jgi:hypothetical protein